VKPAPFSYSRPVSRDEVDALLAELGQDAKILAGGQSLVPMLNFRLVTPAHLIDVNGLRDEPGVPSLDHDRVRFGPLVRHADVEQSAIVAERVPLLREAIAHVAHPAVRSRGTLVGALAHADPASELVAVLVLLDGEVRARSSRGTRWIGAADLFAGPLETTLGPEEWIDEAAFPCARSGEGFALEEFARRHADFALCGVVARASRAPGGAAAVRLAYFGLGEPPTQLSLAPCAEGSSLADSIDRVVSSLDPPEDVHASSAFRSHLARRLAVRAATRAIAAS